MPKVLFGIFIVLHGLVHLWYVTLSQGLVEFQSEMGWTGKSWALSNLFGDMTTRSAASIGYSLAALTLILSGAGLLLGADWWQRLLIGSAVLSSVVIFLFWDGKFQQLVEKGLLGLLINLVILIALFVSK